MGRLVVVELRRYPGWPSRTTETTWLGEDEHGTWLDGGGFVLLIPNEPGWKARHFRDGGWKVDITTETVWDGDRVVLEDLALDVRRHHWQVWVEDRHEFAANVADGTYPADLAATAEATCRRLAASMWDEPFQTTGDRWLARIPSPHSAAVLLDMGGVLHPDGPGTAAAAWEDRLGLDPGAIAAARQAAIGPGWEGGRTVEEVSWNLRAALGIDHAQLWELRRDLLLDAPLDAGFVALLEAMPAGIARCVLSNNGGDVRPSWEAAFDLNRLIDHAFISGEERLAKPDPAFYRLAADRLGVPTERCVFVDDAEANVAGAEAVGMKALLHSSESPAHDALAAAIQEIAESPLGP